MLKNSSTVRISYALPHGSMLSSSVLSHCILGDFVSPYQTKRDIYHPPSEPNVSSVFAIFHWFLKGYTRTNGASKNITFSNVFSDFLDFVLGERTREREPADIHSLYTNSLLFHDSTVSSVLNSAFPCLPGKEMLGYKYTQIHLIHSASVFKTI